MNRLQAQYQRLYLLPGAPIEASMAAGVIGPEGVVRAMVLSLGHPADWGALSPVWQAVQRDLGLPAPGIAVNGRDAFELWFSLAEPVAETDAARFLKTLCARCAGHTAPQRWRCWPSTDSRSILERIPAKHPDSGRWSAFIAPDLPSIFGDDPSLDMKPGDEAQADVLSGLNSITPSAWQSLLGWMDSGPAPSGAAPLRVPGGIAAGGGPQSDYSDPRRFLLEVMNDATVALALRIDAAKALLAVPAHPEAE